MNELEDQIRVYCSNCQKETMVSTNYGTMSQVKKWLNDHKTRIGRTYCSIEYIGFDFSQREQASYEQGRRDGTAKEAERHESMADLAHDMKSKLDDIEKIRQEGYEQGKREAVKEIEWDVEEIVRSHTNAEGKEPLRKDLAQYFIDLKAKYSFEQECQCKTKYGSVEIDGREVTPHIDCEQEKLSYDETVKLVEKIEKAEQEGKE